VISGAASAMLEVSGLEVRYDGAITALEGVDFSAGSGSVVALLGPNGAGKSTLLKAIAGMLPFERGEIVRGRVAIDGAPLNGRHPAAITRSGIALVQDGRQCFRNLTIGENLRAASFMRPHGSEERLRLVHGYFPMLAEMRERPAGLPRVTGARGPRVLGAIAPQGLPALLRRSGAEETAHE